MNIHFILTILLSLGSYCTAENAPPRVLSIAIGDGGIQRSMIRSMTITFDKVVSFQGSPSNAFEILNESTYEYPLVSSVVTDGVTTQVRLTFSGESTHYSSLSDGLYKLRIHSNLVFNSDGELDGNGDGQSGGDLIYPFHRFYGDGNGDRSVDIVDFAIFRLEYGSQGQTFDQDDNGYVDIIDFAQFRIRFGASI